MPQPFQAGPDAGSEKVLGLFAHMAFGEAATSMGSAKDLPVKNSAIARRCGCVERTAIEIMGPVSMAAKTPAGLICLKASRLGARSRPPSWQDAQPCLYHPSPSCADRKLAAQNSSPATLQYIFFISSVSPSKATQHQKIAHSLSQFDVFCLANGGSGSNQEYVGANCLQHTALPRMREALDSRAPETAQKTVVVR